MTRRWLLAGIALTLCAAPALRAQSRTSLSVIPVGGVTLPMGDFIDDPLFKLTPKFGVYVGAIAELSMNKSISFFGEASRTLGATQKLDAEIPNCGVADCTFSTDMATTSVSAGLILRPLGRLPSGAPKTLYVEAGGGMSLYNVSAGFQDPTDPQELDFGGTSAFVMGGVGLSFPAGPRFSVQVGGRILYHLSEYSSDGLDQLESSNFFGQALNAKKPFSLQLGVGLRIGR